MKKSTIAEKAMRVAEVVEFLLDGAPSQHIKRYAASEWGISPRQVDVYVAEATAEIKTMAQEAQEKALDSVCSRLERLYFKAMGKGDYNLARNIVKDMRDLYGLDAPAKIEQSITHKEDKVQSELEKLNTKDLIEIANKPINRSRKRADKKGAN